MADATWVAWASTKVSQAPRPEWVVSIPQNEIGPLEGHSQRAGRFSETLSERATGIEPATFSLGKCPGTVTERASALLSEATPVLEHTGTSLPLRLGGMHGGMHGGGPTPLPIFDRHQLFSRMNGRSRKADVGADATSGARWRPTHRADPR